MITDGENFANIDTQYFTLIKKNEINLIIVGIGSQMGSKLPVLNGFKKDKEGNEVISILDINQINTISQKTGGSYFVFNNQKNNLPSLIESLNKVKSVSQNINQQTVTYNKYIYFLLLALVLIVADFLLTVNVLKL